jgi:hypothetical protein
LYIGISSKTNIAFWCSLETQVNIELSVVIIILIKYTTNASQHSTIKKELMRMECQVTLIICTLMYFLVLAKEKGLLGDGYRVRDITDEYLLESGEYLLRAPIHKKPAAPEGWQYMSLIWRTL